MSSSFDDSSLLREYDSFVPPVLRKTPISDQPKETSIVIDLISDSESSDETCEQLRDQMNELELQTKINNEKDWIVIDSDKEEEETITQSESLKNKSAVRTAPHRPHRVPINHHPVRHYYGKRKVSTIVPQKPKDLRPDTENFSNPLVCELCKVSLLQPRSGFPLQEKCRYQSKILCTGCARLLSNVASKQEYQDVIQFFITGKLPNDALPSPISIGNLMFRLHKRQSDMKLRCLRKRGANSSQIVSLKDLIEICKAGQGRCAISGWRCFLHQSRAAPFWALTFDHVTPVTHIAYRAEAWSKHNIQLMCSILNQIKGCYSDDEIRRWFQRFVQSQVVEID